MNTLAQFFLVFGLFFCIVGCTHPNPNKQVEQGILTENTLEDNDGFIYAVKQEVYVPIYSDIYNKTKDLRFQLTATLSIRNTSTKDSLFIKNVNYYNTSGDFVRSYIEQPIFLKPLESIEYVIEENDTSGGSGANFLITWGAHKDIKPLFQGVMLGVSGQQGFAFTTEGIPVHDTTK